MSNRNHEVLLNKMFSFNELAIIVEHIPEPLCIIRGDEQNRPDRIIYANKKAEELLHLTRMELSNYTLEQLLGIPKDTTMAELEEKHRDEPLHHDDTPLKKHLDGKALKVNLEPFTTDDGKTSFLLTIIDATDLQDTQKQLKKLSSEFGSLFEHSQDIVFVLDAEGNVIDINKTGVEKIGYPREEILETKIEALIPEDEKLNISDNIHQLLVGHTQDVQTKFICRDEKIMDVYITVIPLLVDGVVSELIGVAKDISEYLETNLRLKESEEMYRALFENSLEPVITLDTEGRFLTCNKTTETMMGVPKDALVGVPFLNFLNEDRREGAWEEFKHALKGTPHQYETSFINKEGVKLRLHMSLIPSIVQDEVRYIHCIAKDLTLQKAHDEMIHKMVYEDHLTELKNQRSFHMDVKRWLDEVSTTSVGIWMIDLDRFKFVNDYLGHDEGDEILKSISKKVIGIVGSRGQIYRYGGNTFALVTPDLSEIEIKLLAFQLISQISSSHGVQEFQSLLTASIGISVYPKDGMTLQEILSATDQALQHAKMNGKNQFQIYNSNIKNQKNVNIRMELLLAKAVENEEFTLHYQPQVRTGSHELYGVEALIRWNSPELGFVSPGEFIPLAEETGVIMRIGEWVIEQACQQHVHWKERGLPPIPISINLSLRQFYQNDFIKRVQGIIDKTGVDPSFIMFEITETIAMQEDVALHVLNRLKNIGFKVAMDDFGTGYSSLKYIQTFSIDHLKIDKAFIDKIDTKEGHAIVATIISLGHHLNMKVVAEGVETAEQAATLEALKCDYFQGYYFSRPLPVHELESTFCLESSKNNKRGI